jgi:hypothetical protein
LLRSNYYPDTIDPYGDWAENDFYEPNNFEVILPLANGLFYSENGRFAIVKNTTASHICGKWNKDNLRFMQTSTKMENQTVEFFVLTNISRQHALDFANFVNTFKFVTIKGGAFK